MSKIDASLQRLLVFKNLDADARRRIIEYM